MSRYNHKYTCFVCGGNINKGDKRVRVRQSANSEPKTVHAKCAIKMWKGN